MNNTNKLGWRNWLSIILIGFAGQVAWAIENNILNMWVFSQTGNSEYITWITISSAIVATLTTLFMGALSDRLGKRKVFISFGYTIWGIIVVLYSVFNKKNMAAQYGAESAAFWCGLWLTVINCCMNFFGSSANDACFSARITDVSDETNRGKIESILAILPLLAYICLLSTQMGLGANAQATPEQIEQAKNLGISVEEVLAQAWTPFFLIFGILTSLIGIISFFLLPKDNIKPNKQRSYWYNLAYGFRPKSVKENPRFYLTLLTFLTFNCAVDAFAPYFMVYFQNDPATHNGYGLGLTGNSFFISIGIIMLLSGIAIFVSGFIMDKYGKEKFLLPSLLAAIGGCIGAYYSKHIWSVCLSGFFMTTGWLLGAVCLGAILRDETPENEVGLFQGVRMIFTVMIPMVIGPSISQAFMKKQGGFTIDEFGNESAIPTNVMFIVAIIFLCITLIPAVILYKKEANKRKSLLTPKV